MPKRIQRRRTKGWRKPEGAVCVTRPGRWGNPYRVGDPHPRYLSWHWSFQRRIETAEEAVECFWCYALGRLSVEPEWLAPLRGKDLACYCAPGAVCHADVLLELANQPGARAEKDDA